MNPKIHTYTSQEPMLKVNAFIVETDRELVIVDTTLTMSDAQGLKQLAAQLKKPIAGIVLTHGHPDHVAGTSVIVPQGDVPIFALPSVAKLMEVTEQEKHAQWSGMFGPEWIPKWVHPNTMVRNGENVQIAGLTFQVIDLGSGGDCDANSIWLLEGADSVAFLGDFIYNGNHTYMNDGSILRWLANLERHAPLLKKFSRYYIGHGPSCDFSAIELQKRYIHFYCAQLLACTEGTGVLSEASRQRFEKILYSSFPDYGCQFMVGLSAARVARELADQGKVPS